MEPTPAPAPRASVVALVVQGGRCRSRQRHSRCIGFAAALMPLPGAAHTRCVRLLKETEPEAKGISSQVEGTMAGRRPANYRGLFIIGVAMLAVGAATRTWGLWVAGLLFIAGAFVIRFKKVNE